MSRLTNKDYKTSNIDQILCGAKTNKSFNEILDDHNRILIENALHKLAEYENLGSLENLKMITSQMEDIQNGGIYHDIINDRYYDESYVVDFTAPIKQIIAENVKKQRKKNKSLKHELEVYKRALNEISKDYSDKIRDGIICDADKETVRNYYLDQARKELEDERN